MLIQILLFIAGLLLLVKGADWLVGGASALAKKYNISDLAIGLTIVAFGTSAPEMIVNIFAAKDAHYDVVMGNIIGSNIFNLFFILGIAGIITPLVVQVSTVWKEIPLSLFAAIILLLLANNFFGISDPTISTIDGIFLLCVFAGFLFYVYKQMKAENYVPSEISHVPMSNLKITLFILGGLGGLIAGGKLVISSSVDIAHAMGISEKIIGLTIVAAGTSLPELATSVVAALKKKCDIAVGNVIGSNIFNIFLILATSSLVKPIIYNTNFNRDIFILILGTIFLFVAMFTGQKKKLDRWEAALLLITFIGYTTYLIIGETMA